MHHHQLLHKSSNMPEAPPSHSTSMEIVENKRSLSLPPSTHRKMAEPHDDDGGERQVGYDNVDAFGFFKKR